MKKTLLLIKWENITLLLLIPLAIIQFLKAHIDYKLISILASLVLYGGTYLMIYVSRKEALEELKDVKAKPILEPIKRYINNCIAIFKGIKKEIIRQASYKDDQVQYKKRVLN